ncbi:MAG: L-threonylcarbamoyladenylate synthase [bacterium]
MSQPAFFNLKANSPASCAEALTLCRRVLDDAGVVIVPTDTVYGIACRADFAESVQRIFKIKHRPANQPLALLVSQETRPSDYGVQEDETLHRLLERWWPGALTVVAPSSLSLIEGLQGPEKTVGLRAPNHAWLQELLRRLPQALAATSANRSGEPEVFRIGDLDKEMLAQVDLVIDAGPVSGDPRPSTVVGKKGRKWTVFREGSIPNSEIEPLLDVSTLKIN